jgi:peptide deformylase
MALAIRKYPDPILRRRAQEIQTFDGETRKLADQLVEAMVLAKGYGLAAPQVGILKRLIAIDLEDQLFVLVNPEIAAAGPDKVLGVEGCLSLPGVEAEVLRPARVTVRACTPQGEAVTMESADLLARVLQHEIDHLNGVLFFDYLSEVKRLSLLKEYERVQREVRSSTPRKALTAL